MPSQDKLIKQGIKYTDSLFDEINKRLEKGILSSDTLESFLNKTKEYTTNNPLVTTGYDKKMLDLILQETNNHKFSRPAQKELVRVTIENQVGDLITNVGEDIKEDVRDIVKSGYNEGLSQDEIADNISSRITVIKNTRARTIARTEIARTATVSDYIINKERGANYFVVDCRSTRCPVCKEAYCKSSEIGGDVEYDIEDVGMLPPKHPNCRCVAVFGIDPKRKKTKPTEDTEPATTRELTPEELKNLKAAERARYRNLQKTIKAHEDWLRANPNASADEISSHKSKLAQAKNKLEELKVKAIGGNVGATPEHKPTSTPKPTETKEPPKTKKEQPITVTQEQLENGLTYSELQDYKYKLKNIKKLKKWLEGDPLSMGFTQSDIERAKQQLKEDERVVETLKRKALTAKPKKELKPVELEAPFDKSKHLTKEELDKMDFKELAEHHGAEYLGVQEYDYDSKKYHTIKQTFDDGREFTLRFEEGAVKSYTKQGIATPNEIIHEVFKVPEALRIETREIWFKNTNHGIHHKPTKSRYDSFDQTTGGYNTWNNTHPSYFDNYEDFNHRIVINPKYFKGGGKGKYAYLWKYEPDNARNWKMAIFHEFSHSGDTTTEMWQTLKKGNMLDHSRVSYGDEYRKIEQEERGFTWYANTTVTESYAEHGGYIAYMESNPSEQHKKIRVTTMVDGKSVSKNIDYDEYKKMYPKHHAFFMKKFKEGF